MNRLDGEVTSPPHELEREEIKAPHWLKAQIIKHSKVFQSPQGLPPVRGHEHVINLKEGTDPVTVRPFRYPQSQKNEIEGLIRASNSPFSNPVLLVKKKDGS